MMRACVLVAIASLAAGCYRPSTEARCTVVCGASGACPNGLACNSESFCTPDGVACQVAPGDATAADATDDGATTSDGSAGCAPFSGRTPVFVMLGNSYTEYGMDSAYWSPDDMRIHATRDGITMAMGSGFMGPRMAPGGTEIFMNDGMKQLYRTTWSGSVWLTPIAVVTNVDVEPGTVTTTVPRRMYATMGTQIMEGTGTSDTWSFVPLGTFNLEAATDPSVDPTGTRMVFVGTEGTGNKAIYLTTADGNGGWSNPLLFFDVPGDELTPFLSPDCTTLFYTHDGNVYRVQQ